MTYESLSVGQHDVILNFATTFGHLNGTVIGPKLICAGKDGDLHDSLFYMERLRSYRLANKPY